MATKNNGDVGLAVASRNGRNGESPRARRKPAAPTGQEATRAAAPSRKRSSDDVVQGPTFDEYQGLLTALRTLREGDFTVRLPAREQGAMFELATAFNEVAQLNDAMAREVVRVSRVVGREGRMTERALLRGAKGGWGSQLESINSLILDLVRPSTEVARVITAVAGGDLSEKMALEIEGKPVRGEFLRIGETVNTMVDQLRSFAAEVTRVAKEVGTEGKLGGQAHVPGVAGTWKDLTDSVNSMASNLTTQVRGIAGVVTAVADGDLTKKLVVEAKGEIAALADTINNMTDTLRLFAEQVTTVAREVGTEGKLGGQARVPGVAGTWKDLTDNVNSMASNLTDQVRNIALVTTAVANGDLSQKMSVEVEGEILELKNTFNRMVDQLRAFASEVTRVAREVGTDGKLGGQAQVPGVTGAWKDLTESVNYMANNLTDQVRNIKYVTTAVANGDLSQKISVDVKGEMLELKNTMNTMVDQLNSFAAEVTRVAREVGTEGRLGGQAHVPGVAGTWKDLTDNVNYMASNLTGQVRSIALVTTAVANGDLSKKIVVDARGEILELKSTINTMVDQLNSFAGEVTRVAREVGTEGKLGGQANVPGVAGTWKDLTDNVNYMASNLTGQVRNIALVTTAVANGDLSQKITVDVKGEMLEMKNTLNTMVDQLRAFAAEVTRVAREVGTEGRLGGQAHVPEVAGTWKDLTDSVNYMANNLTEQVRNIKFVTTAVANGDLSQKITVDVKGELLELKNTINTMVDQLRAFGAEVTRVAREVGTDGKLGGQAFVPGVAGVWKDLTENVNSMATNLTTQVRGIAKVVTAVANGDLTKKFVVEAKGEIAELADTINSMTETLGVFAEQVTTVAREVGTEGKLGGQARVPGVAGTWKDLTDSVNSMASNLTTQVRGIIKVVTAVANGDLSQKLLMEAQGEMSALAETINSMTDTLRVFADQVTTVAREVGTEGKLGGQAKVPGAAGTWRDLTDNVNQLAGNLTAQVRAIADVAVAVTNGDLTRSIAVEAQGELLLLKDTVNQMIANLRETTQKNQEQDWLKTNLAKFGGMMQGQKNLEAVSRLIMSELTPLVSAHHGAFFIATQEEGETVLKLIASYAYKQRKSVSNRFSLGEGLVGQAALEKKSLLLTNVPHDYIVISSGLGEASPLNIIVLPVLFEGEVRAVLELASFRAFSQIHQIFLDQLSESIGVVLNMIVANMRTEELLLQSQGLTQELQSQSKELQQQQEELKKTNTELEAQAASLKASEELLKAQQEELQQINEELEEKATLLAEQNKKVEQKNREVEFARRALEDKAAQLSLSSRYKSEFLANMSHELRTPLNSLLILAKMLSDNKERNLSDKQVEYARTIHASGTDLLNLINEVLDLSKVEAGKIEIYPSEVRLAAIEDYIERSFRPLAQQKALEFTVVEEPELPESLNTDGQRLQQILRNLLANAFKFTERGSVTVRIGSVENQQQFTNVVLMESTRVIAMSVHDTGIGIPRDKHQLIFEAFQQADGTTSRKFGGTGLGLSISRELARLLGGEIHVESAIGEGSTFTLYLPPNYREQPRLVAAESRKESRRLEAGDAMPARARPSLPGANGTGPIPLGDDDDSLGFDGDADFGELVSNLDDEAMENELNDDRDAVQPGDRVLLIIEDDTKFANVLLDMARERGFKCIATLRGDIGLALVHRYKPDAILLDLALPVVDGLTVLDRLKHNRETRHIPVHILSGTGKRQRGMKLGAFAYLEKPVTKEALDRAFDSISQFLDNDVRNLLIVDNDEALRRSMEELIGQGDVSTVSVGTAEEALELLRGRHVDCMVLGLGLADMSSFELLEKIKSEPELRDLPIIIYTDKELTPEEDTRLKKYAETIILKDVKSPERLLDETALFLHRVEANLPEEKRRVLEELHSSDAVFAGKKVMVVDDDVRNIFAITSVLESNGMNVVFAENGKDGIVMLDQNQDVSLILMDVMMPEMDGYETMRQIRKNPAHRTLPIIALTAKAMKGDREKCIAAGASDYITKPVDPDQLISLMRVWMYR
ncbi:HAMP domain-containing protein [Pendulispora albinea]|uniref:histidine kinase n=1 Tax=Pendulispora albinea TaxID=2741071 RepID=A0ABZ2LQN4_9BACT